MRARWVLRENKVGRNAEKKNFQIKGEMPLKKLSKQQLSGSGSEI